MAFRAGAAAAQPKSRLGGRRRLVAGGPWRAEWKKCGGVLFSSCAQFGSIQICRRKIHFSEG
jgi:hypothetical protein